MKRAVAIATALLALLAAGDRVDPVNTGLAGAYYTNTGWSDPPAVAARDPQLTTQRLKDAWRGAPPAQFSATWTGWILILRDDAYGFATLSDDGSFVYVDGQLVVDNGGSRVSPRGASGAVTLTRGVHAMHVRYVQEGGPYHLDVMWTRAGQPLQPIPAWALAPRRPGFWAFALSAALRQALAAAEWLWVGTIVLWALTVVWVWILRGRTWLEHEQVWPALKWIVAGSLLLNLVAIGWGLPGGGWAPDELAPLQVLGAAAQRFAHGWFDRYPPLHFYVLTVVFSPILLLDWFGRIDVSTSAPYALLTLVSRLVSVAAGAGTLLAIYACGARTFGKRSGVLAAAAFAAVTPFVYYAKTANLDAPYVFWFAMSLVFYLRLLESLRLRDIVAFAAFATLAICTKDQAYGLYLLTPLVIIERLWRVHRNAGARAPLARAVFDPRLGWAALVAVVLFAASHNLLFNTAGFIEHVRYITGGGSETYRDFAPTAAGRFALLTLSVDLVRRAWGWPMFAVCVAGLVVAFATPRHRRSAVWLLVPVVSYYLGFINVVLYNYDRFMLPVCLVLSLFGGLALDRWLSADRVARVWRTAGASAVFACTLLYAAQVDLAMLRDSRYTVEQWLASHVRQGELVGFVFPPQYYPRLELFNNTEITSIPSLADGRPGWFVLNADYARAEPPESEIGRLIAGLQNGTLGYSLELRYREPAPLQWLPGSPRDLVGDRTERPITSVLRQINPWYEVFKRRQ